MIHSLAYRYLVSLLAEARVLIDNAKHLPTLLARAPSADGFPKRSNSICHILESSDKIF